MSAADQQSLNAVKAALQNAQARSEGGVARGRGEQPFVCATVGLRIHDLTAVVSLADACKVARESADQKRTALLGIAAQRDELTAGVEKLTATCNALTDRVKELEALFQQTHGVHVDWVARGNRAEAALAIEQTRHLATMGQARDVLLNTIESGTKADPCWCIPGRDAAADDRDGHAEYCADARGLIASLPAGPRAVR